MSIRIDAISVVVPMYNEAGNAKPLIEEIHRATRGLSQVEIIVVDDGSRDETVAELKSLQATIPHLRVLKHYRNFGQSAGIVSGVRNANHPWIVTLDGDGQNDPADIPNLIQALQQQANDRLPVLIVGNRKQRNDNFLRHGASRIAYGIRKLLLQDDCPDTGCGLKLFPRHEFMKLPHFNHVHRYLPALFKRAGGSVLNIPVNHRPRLKGQSKYGVLDRMWVGIFDLIGVIWLIRRPCNPEIDPESC